MCMYVCIARDTMCIYVSYLYLVHMMNQDNSSPRDQDRYNLYYMHIPT